MTSFPKSLTFREFRSRGVLAAVQPADTIHWMMLETFVAGGRCVRHG